MRPGRDPSWVRAAGMAVMVVAAASLAMSGWTRAQSSAPVAPAPASPAPGAIRVVVTTSVLADIVRQIGGSHAAVVSIIPPGVGPEDYEPRPADAQLLTQADLIVSNGVGLDDFLDKLLSSGAGADVPQLVLGAGMQAIVVDGSPNPHFWLDPTLVRDGYVPQIVHALGTADPAHALDFQAAGAAYATLLTDLDHELQGVVSGIPGADRKLVTFHDAFPYLAAHFGFQLIGVIVPNVGAEPSAAALAALVDTIKATGVRAVFSEAQFDPGLAETLADDAGITTIVSDLYTDALGPAPADTYLGLMRLDMDRIAAALR